MEPKVVKDEYGRLYFIQDSPNFETETQYWGYWWPCSLTEEEVAPQESGENPGNEKPEGETSESKNQESLVIECVVNETHNYLETLNSLVLETNDLFERARLYELISDIGDDMSRFIKGSLEE